MEAANIRGNTILPSAPPASGDGDAAPLKLQLEVTLPRELGGELKAWRRSFERFADVMEALAGKFAEPSRLAYTAPDAVDECDAARTAATGSTASRSCRSDCRDATSDRRDSGSAAASASLASSAAGLGDRVAKRVGAHGGSE